MSTETKAAQTAPAATSNRIVSSLASVLRVIDPDFDPNNPVFKMLTAGYLLHLGTTVKDPKLKATFQKEALNLF